MDYSSTLNNIESALNDVKSTVGGFADNDGTFSKGIRAITDKLSSIDSVFSSNMGQITNATSFAGTKLMSIDNYIGEINGQLKSLNKHFVGKGTANQSYKKINKNIEDAIQVLKSIEQHVGNSPSNTTGATASSTAPINNIDKNVAGILSAITAIKADLAAKQFNSSNNELNKLIEENLKLSETDKNFSLRLSAYKEKGVLYDKDGVELKKGTPEFKTAEEDILREYRERQERSKKFDKRLNRGQKGWEIATNVTNEITGFLSNDKPTVSGLADKGIGAISKHGIGGQITAAILSLIKAMLELGSKIDRASSDFARNIGGGVSGKNAIGDTIQRALLGMSSLARARGYTSDAAFSALTEIAEARGRTTERTSAQGVYSAIDLRRFGIGGEAVNNFDTFGKSLEETDKYFAKLYSQVSKRGLSFKNVSKAVNDNLKAAQSHTFSRGLKGLEQMAERSVQLKYNMQQVFQLADKISTIEGAISTAANLSVLGGTFAQYSNPMQLLYEGLNDMESLQDRMEKMFGEKAFWNQEKGQIDVAAIDREMIKQAASAAGLSPDEMLSMTYSQGRRREVERQIGTGLNGDTAEYIKNIAELDKNGKAFVTLDGITKAVSELTEADKEMLKKESNLRDKSEGAKLGDIYYETSSIGEKADNILSYLKEKLGAWVYGLFRRFSGGIERAEANAQGEGEDEALKQARLELFRRESEENGYMGILGMSNRGMSRAQEIGRMDRVTAMEMGLIKGANGINPSFSKPGDGGFLIGKSHADGGIKGRYNNMPFEAEGGEYLINKNSSSKYRNVLKNIQNGTYNPYSYANDLIKNNMQQYFKPINVAPSNQAASPVQGNQGNGGNVSGRIKIDIPQTITINLAGGEKIGDYDVRGIVMNYVDKFMKEAIMRQNFSGFDKENFYNKSNVI